MEKVLQQILTELKEVKANQADTNTRLDSMDQRFDQIDGRLDQMDQRFDQIDGRLDSMDQRFDRMDRRIDMMQDGLDALGRDVARFNNEVEPMIKVMMESMDLQRDRNRQADRLLEKTEDHETRIWVLEQKITAK